MPAHAATATNEAETRNALLHLQSLVSGKLPEVNALILQRLQSDVPLIPQIAQHLFAAGGKRLRPVLALTSARLCGYNGPRDAVMAACVELIHTATLLHDDVVDESMLRRGKESANSRWGNQASVLVGDFLLSRAFQLMVDDGSLDVLRILSHASAVIAAGEVEQLAAAHDPETTQDTYLSIISAKTAELFAAAAELGAVVAGNEDARPHLRDYGMNLGIAFQIADDALDYAASQAALGKTVGDDFAEGKITLPVIHCYRSGDEAECGFWQRTLAERDIRDSDLQEALRLMERHKAIEYALGQATIYCIRAKEALHRIPGIPAGMDEIRDAMLDAADFAIRRAY